MPAKDLRQAIENYLKVVRKAKELSTKKKEEEKTRKTSR